MKVAVLFARRGPRRLHQRGFEPGRARPRPRRVTDAVAYIEPGTQARPRNEVPGAGERRHVVPDLRQDHRRRDVAQAGHRGQETDGGAKGDVEISEPV